MKTKDILRNLKSAELDTYGDELMLLCEDFTILADEDCFNVVIENDKGDYYTAPSFSIQVYAVEPKFKFEDESGDEIEVDLNEKSFGLVKAYFEELYADYIYRTGSYERD